MRNIITFLCLLLLLLFIFVGKTYHDASINKTTFNQIFPLQSMLTKQVVENYFSQDENLKEAAEMLIKKSALKDLGYENWTNYIEYIEIILYPIDIINGPTEDLIIVLNLSKDIGVIGMYTSIDNNYIRSYKIEDLSYIESISSVKISQLDKAFLIVEEVLEENLGSFSKDHYIQIFTLKNSSFQEVYRQSINYETYYNEKWSNPSLENPTWFKLKEKSLIDHIVNKEDSISFNVSKTISKFSAPDTKDGTTPEEFSLIEERNFDITYIWSEIYGYFILGEGKIQSTEKLVGILEDTYHTADSYLNLGDKYYKVIDKSGRIEYINNKDIIVISNYSNEL